MSPRMSDQDANLSRAREREAGRELVLGGVKPSEKAVDLRDLGFVGYVSDGARAEIAANERRAQRVISTAHLYWFGKRR